MGTGWDVRSVRCTLALQLAAVGATTVGGRACLCDELSSRFPATLQLCA
jgi:hypothetical protein